MSFLRTLDLLPSKTKMYWKIQQQKKWPKNGFKDDFILLVIFFGQTVERSVSKTNCEKCGFRRYLFFRPSFGGGGSLLLASENNSNSPNFLH